ncbi:Unknown protein [Striga hermonthica]|uniref:Uncharacterized protein n=1 Tax=Striga hermonthica TaxID=68872 RepID=A0A9N7P1R7_STRHE|nr:Unknown protein [Striga hermonthica]
MNMKMLNTLLAKDHLSLEDEDMKQDRIIVIEDRCELQPSPPHNLSFSLTSKDEKMSVDKGKVSSAAEEDHEAISIILNQPLATRFLDDPIINGLCDRLAEHQPLVKTAQQLLKALRGSKVLEDGNLNDDALKHFALLLKTWRCKHFRSGINEIIHQSECVLPAVIEELSDGVTSEKIEERMCRIKGDQNLGHILEVANPPATMIRGLLIVVIGYWSYKKLPVEEMCDILEDDECDVVEDKVDNVGGDVLDERLMLEREEHNEWLMKYGSPVQKLDEEPAIEELADDLEKDPRLSEKLNNHTKSWRIPTLFICFLRELRGTLKLVVLYPNQANE